MIEPDYHFNDSLHKANFLKYMFVTSKTQLQKHEKDGFIIHVNGKTYDTQGEKGLSDRQKALQILTEKEVDIQNNLQKAFLIYLETEEASDDFDEAFNMIAEILDSIPKTTSNITYVCAVSHFNQKTQSPHIHVFYEAKRDVEDEIQNIMLDNNS